MNAVKKPDLHGNAGTQNTLRIVFKWPGDDFADQQDLEIRDRIEGLIRERGVGKIMRVGTGMGWMDILVEAEDKDSATPKLEAIIKTAEPEIVFTIEDMERTF